MRPIDPTFVPRLTRGVRLRFDRHASQTMILAPERGYVLNESAAEVATRCDGRRSIAEIVAAIAIERGLRPEAIEADVIGFVAELREKGLFE